MSTEKIREEYNAWYAEKIGVLGTRQHKEWFAPWSASRSAIEVEWPDQHTYTAPDCAGAAILDCRTAFNKAVKVKP